MKKLETTVFTFEQAVEEYKKYNKEISRMIASIDNMLLFGGIDEIELQAFSSFRSFAILFVDVNNYLDEVDYTLISHAVISIFNDNLEELEKLKVTDKNSSEYAMLMKLIISSEYPQSVMISGLNKLIEFNELIEQVEDYYKENFNRKEERVFTYHSYNENEEDILDYSAFLVSLNKIEGDEAKIDLIRQEIRRVKINCIGPEGIYFVKNVEIYTRYLEEYMKVLQQYGDDSIKIKSNTSSQSSINITRNTPEPKFEEPEGTEPASTTPRNKNHTVVRKCIAMYYLLNKMSPDVFSEGNIKPLSRFVHFLTGNNEKNIYDYLLNIDEALGVESDKRKRANVEFVAAEFEKIGLGVIAEQIKRDIEANDN